MKCIINLTALIIVATLAGCAHKPPSCDGGHRRPVNQDHQANLYFPSCDSNVASTNFYLGAG